MFRFDSTSQDHLCGPAPRLAKLRVRAPDVEVRFPIIGRTWGNVMVAFCQALMAYGQRHDQAR
jgi:hypothetical protein